MPALKPSWEKVAQALALGESQRVAYLAGGFKYNRAGAHRLCHKPEITTRVAEIRAQREEHDSKARQEAAKRSGIDIAWIEEQQAYVVRLAMRGHPVRDKDGRIRRDPETQQPIYKPDLQAANQGLITLGRMKGAFIDRTEIGAPGDFARLSDEDLNKKLLEQARELGLPEEVILQLTYQPAEAAE